MSDQNGSEFADELLSLAKKHWLPQEKKKRPKFNSKIVDQIFQGLNERSFPLQDLLVLDQTLYLEKYMGSRLCDADACVVICCRVFQRVRLIRMVCRLRC
jgi:Intron-binding protein aquarius N-terminal